MANLILSSVYYRMILHSTHSFWARLQVFLLAVLVLLLPYTWCYFETSLEIFSLLNCTHIYYYCWLHFINISTCYIDTSSRTRCRINSTLYLTSCFHDSKLPQFLPRRSCSKKEGTKIMTILRSQKKNWVQYKKKIYSKKFPKYEKLPIYRKSKILVLTLQCIIKDLTLYAIFYIFCLLKHNKNLPSKIFQDLRIPQ